MKKLLSVLLCMCMLLSVTAYAKSYTVGISDDGFSSGGAWLASGVKGADGTSSMYSKEGAATATFASPLKTAGNAKVEFYNISNSSDPKLTIQVTYNTDKTTAISIDQTKTPDGWVDLGVYNFDAAEGEGVTVIRGLGNTRINSVRFTETKDAVSIQGEEAEKVETKENEEQEKDLDADNPDAIVLTLDNSEKTGDWKESSLSGFTDKKSVNTTEKGATVFYKAPVTSGNAKVAFFNIQEGSAPDGLLEVIYDGDKVYSQEIDQNQVPKGWVNLGIFNFTGAEGEGIRFTKNSSGGYARVAEVRFVPTEEKITVKEEVVIPPEAFEGDDMANIKMEGFETVSGKWLTSQLRGFCETGSAYCGEVGGSAKWDPQLDTPNMVTIYIYKLVYENNVNDALYQVHHDGKVEDIRVNLKEGTTGWHCLGTFKFSGNGDEYVTVTKDKETDYESYIRADAVKFIAVSDDEAINNNIKRYIIVDNDPPIYFMVTEFSDTTDHWAKANISLMANRGLVKGVGEDVFNPDGNISRAEFTTLLTRILELAEVDKATFADSEGWYKGYLAAAVEADLFNGLPIENNQIYPDKPITREEMALMIANAGKAKNKPIIAPETTKTVTDFTDGASVSAFATSACQYVIDNKIITGYEDNTFRPVNTATRAEATVMLQRFLEQVLWAGPVDMSKQWTLTFSDDFNGDAIDTNVWVSENKANGWSAIFSSRYPENLEVKDGYLYMHTKKNNPDPQNEWSTAYIWTKEFKQKYGYFEARYKYNDASGVNNAFWLMTDGQTNGLYPGEHEIDINEGHYPNRSTHNLHYYDKTKETRVDSGYAVDSRENYARDFHIFACEWTPEEIIFYVDGKETRRASVKDTAMEDTESVVRFSTAVSTFAGKVTDALDGKSMVVDYVRVYQTDYNK
ncbi:MAG: S-layer homology domain-containing protein [Clostridia bacterium]|nr:S-layer homology domain-containing protein [Clostridia bacterium]